MRRARVDRLRALSVLTVLLAVVYEFFALHRFLPPITGTLLSGSVVGAFVVEMARDARAFRWKWWRHRWPDLLFVLPTFLALSSGSLRAAESLLTLRLLARELIDALSSRQMRPLLQALLRRPLTLLVLTFGFTILCGTLGLMFPAATSDGRGASFLTALFTATSATCVTGLSVVDPALYFSRFGQWVVLVLIQVGGLGLMTITTTLALAFRSSLSSATHGAMQEILEEETVQGFQRMLFSIVSLTLGLELLGAACLWPILTTDTHGQLLSWSDRLFYSVFHAVSAFCNAGFALYSDGMMRFVGHAGLNLTLMFLLILGGLGFPVLSSLLNLRSWKKGPRHLWAFLPVHARVVLVTSLGLWLLGALLFGVMEQNHSLGALNAVEKFWATVFMSASTRSAGFNSVDLSQMSRPALLWAMIWMYIGGSPGGTAGGIKTTTVAVLTLTFWALLKRREEVEVFGRSIPQRSVYRATAVALISLGLLFALSLLLLWAEPRLPFEQVMFEAVSAFGTVGLSTGITAAFSVSGQLLLCALMFLGRLGPFTLALAIGLSKSKATYQFPSTKIVVG